MSEHPSDEERHRQEVGDEAYHRATVLTRLDRSLTSVLDELKEIRVDLADRPTRTEQTVTRRMTALILLIVIFATLQAKDWHNEICGPGARAESGVDYVATVDAKDFDRDELRRRLNEPVPTQCDVTFPFHTHLREAWPSDLNLLGMAAYATLLLLGWTWYRLPIWRERRQRHGDPKKAPPPPWDGVGEPPEGWDGETERRARGRRRSDK